MGVGGLGDGINRRPRAFGGIQGQGVDFSVESFPVTGERKKPLSTSERNSDKLFYIFL